MSKTQKHLHSLESPPSNPFLVATISNHINGGQLRGRGLYGVDWYNVTPDVDSHGVTSRYTLDFSLHYDRRMNKRHIGSYYYYVSFQIDRNNKGEFVPTRVAGVVGRESRRSNIPCFPKGLTCISGPALDNALGVIRLALDDDRCNAHIPRVDRGILRKAIKEYIKNDLVHRKSSGLPVSKVGQGAIQSPNVAR